MTWKAITLRKKYTICKRFIRSCYACFLSHKSSPRSKLGVYPLPTCAMQEVSVDLAENLNKVSGFFHLLIVKCALSGFTQILPLVSKSSSEVNRTLKIVCYYSIRYSVSTRTMPVLQSTGVAKKTKCLGSNSN